MARNVNSRDNSCAGRGSALRVAFDDSPADLVPGDVRKRQCVAERHVSADNLDIALTDAAGGDFDERLSWIELRPGKLTQLEAGLVIN